MRAHHAREANLKRQARIGRRAQFRIQIAQHAQDIREAIDSKHLSLARHARQRALRRVHGNRPIGKRQHIQIAHVRGQIAHESSQVGARFNIFGNPGEARRRIARGNRSNNAAHVVDVERAQNIVGNFHGHVAVAERDKLFEHGKRIAHSALGAMRHQIEGVAFELHVFRRAHSTKAGDDFLVAQTVEIKALTARLNGFGNFLRIGGAHDEHHVARGFFERFQQRVKRRDREHVNLVDDIDLVAPARGSILNATDNFLAHIIDARAACRVELVDIGMVALGNGEALFARAIRSGRGPLLAQKRLGEQTRCRGFTRAAGAAEHVGVAYFVLLDGVFERALDMGLAHHVFKRLRAVLAV